ncbi:MAG: SDR family NAD(P)-dependent oxidoreductase [Actinobacteria bacterium]|nr:SDR family NAD(P)-dependent oxidoreductase [Actinomycetota bacterium]
MELRGAVAVVTGASSGIGWSTAWALASRGALVVPTARRMERLEKLAAAVRERGGDSFPVECDVADPASVARLKDIVVGRYGACDVLVNNAGIPGGGPFAELTSAQVERVVRTNFMGVLYTTKALLPAMLERGRGHVVNVASLAGRYALPGSSVYSATKHAVVAFSEALHYETSPRGVLVTAVNPGLVSTERFPHSSVRGLRARMVMPPERIARTILKVLDRGIAPEISEQRWLAAFQVLRILTPPVYREMMRRGSRVGPKPTRAPESD